MKPNYIDSMLDGAKESIYATNYYDTISKIKNYDKVINTTLLKEKEERPLEGKLSAILFCYDPFVLTRWFEIYPEFNNVLVVFPDVDFLFTILPKIEHLFEYKSFKPIAFKNESIMSNSIVANMTRFKITDKGIMIYKYECSDSLYNNVNYILNVIYDVFDYNIIDINTSRIHGDNTLNNEIVSLGMFEKYPYTNILHNLHKGKPIICIAGGKSLEEDIEFLKTIQDEVYIIMASAVVKPLLAHGIKPDLVTVLDMQPIVMDYLNGVEEKLIVCAETTVYKDNWKLKHDFIISPYSFLTKEYYYRILEEIGITLEIDKIIGGSMSVALMSIQIANLMGASKIILLGQDFCFIDGNTETHVSGCVHSTPIPEGEYLEVETISGKKGYMDKQFDIYKSYLEKKILELKLDIINCSKGVHIEHTKEMLLCDAYNEFLIGYEYKDIPLELKIQSQPFKHTLKRFWDKLNKRCTKILQYNDKKIQSDMELLQQEHGLIIDYVKRSYLGIGEYFDFYQQDNILLLHMIINVAKKYKELL